MHQPSVVVRPLGGHWNCETERSGAAGFSRERNMQRKQRGNRGRKAHKDDAKRGFRSPLLARLARPASDG